MRIIITLIVSLAMFMEAVDTTILNTAIPAMAHSLSVDPVDLKIALISYLLTLSIFIPISGWIADKFGIKRVFIVAVLIFIVSSFWCGYAKNLMELVIARSLQGLGGSLTLPLGRLIIVRTFPRHELVAAMGHVVMVASVGLMLGPVLGGVITHYFSWSWIFWVNVPVGLITILLAWKWLPDVLPQTVPPLDKLGFILFGVGLAGLTFGLSAFSETTMNPMNAVLVIVVAVLLLIWYVWHSRHKAHPIIRTQLFSSRTFQISVTGNLLARLGFGGVPFLLPLLFQIGLGYPAQISGLLLAPTAIGVFLVKLFSVRLLRFLGYKKLLILNTLLVGCVLFSFMIIQSHTSFYMICFLTFIFGFLISMQYAAMNSLAYAETAPEFLSSATSIMSTLQQFSQSLGVAVAAILIRYSIMFTSSGLLTTPIFHHVFFAMGILTLLSILVFIRLKPEDGLQMMKQK